MPFDASRSLDEDQLRAILEAELLTDSARAYRHRLSLSRCLVPPRLVQCLAGHPRRGVGPRAVTPMWLLFEEPAHFGDRYWIGYDPELQSYRLGIWEGMTPWCLNGSGSFLGMLDQVLMEAA